MASPNVPWDIPSVSFDHILTNCSNRASCAWASPPDAARLRCILLDGLGDGYRCLMAPPNVIEMASHLTVAVALMRLRRLERALGPSSPSFKF